MSNPSTSKGTPVSITQQPEHSADHHLGGPREDAHAVRGLALLAEEARIEAMRNGDDAYRLETAVNLLGEYVARPASQRTSGLDRALHREDGVLDEALLARFLQLVGHERYTGRAALQRIRGDRDGRLVAGGHAVSDRLHRIADGQLGLHQNRSEQAEQAHSALASSGSRVPAQIQPGRMFPPAPPETPAESTGQLLEAVREAGFEVPAELERAARKDHQAGPAIPPDTAVAGPDLGPAASPEFGASALPMLRGPHSTRELPAVTADTVTDAEPAAEPRPFDAARGADDAQAGDAADD